MRKMPAFYRGQPLPKGSPLWDLPNMYFSSHVATSPGKFFARLHELFRDNVSRYLEGRELLNEVNMRR